MRTVLCCVTSALDLIPECELLALGCKGGTERKLIFFRWMHTCLQSLVRLIILGKKRQGKAVPTWRFPQNPFICSNSCTRFEGNVSAEFLPSIMYKVRGSSHEGPDQKARQSQVRLVSPNIYVYSSIQRLLCSVCTILCMRIPKSNPRVSISQFVRVVYTLQNLDHLLQPDWISLPTQCRRCDEIEIFFRNFVLDQTRLQFKTDNKSR